MEEYIYDAFISYRHTEPDRFAAENLHRMLEAFRLPKNLAREKRARNERATIKRIFRDRDELPLANNLEEPILEALKHSEYLIVICSPRLRESRWCRKEIETFIALHGRDKVFAVLVEGEPDESFPEELLTVTETVTDPDGATYKIEKNVEPLAADIRGKTPREIKKAMKEEVLRLAAPMFGVGFDDLKQRHREQRIKRIAIFLSIAAAVFLAFGSVSTVMALRIKGQNVRIEGQNAEIQKQNEEILRQNEELSEKQDKIEEQNNSLLDYQARNLAEQALELYENGDRVGAVRTAVQSLTVYEGNAMPYTVEGQYALTESTRVYNCGKTFKPYFNLETWGDISNVWVSPDGEKALVKTGDIGEIALWDLQTGETTRNLELMVGIGDISSLRPAFLDNDRLIWPNASGSACVFNYVTGEITELNEIQGALTAHSAPDFSYFVLSSNRNIWVVDSQSMEIIGTWEMPDGRLSGIQQTYFFFHGKPTYGVNNFRGESIPGRQIFAFAYLLKGADDIYRTTVCFFDVQEGGVCSEYPVGRSEVTDICFEGDLAYLLVCELNQNGIERDTLEFSGDYDAILRAMDYRSKEIFWEKRWEKTRSGDVFLPGDADDNDRLWVTTSTSLRQVNKNTGQEEVCYAVSDNVLGGMISGPNFSALTTNGSYYMFLGEKQAAIYSDMQPEVPFRQTEGMTFFKRGMLVWEKGGDNVIAFTLRSGLEEEREECSTLYTVPETPYYIGEPGYSKSKEELEQLGITGFQVPRPATISRVFYDAEEKLYFVSRRNCDFEIYDLETGEQLAYFPKVDNTIFTTLFGRDGFGNLYVGNKTLAYMLNPEYRLIGRIEYLVSVDARRNRLILQYTSSQFSVPVYTLEELLAKAQQYVLN